MQLRSYDKKELAMLYFPQSAPQVAMRRLKRWINKCPELSKAMDDCLLDRRARFFTKKQVELIFEYLDEP